MMVMMIMMLMDDDYNYQEYKWQYQQFDSHIKVMRSCKTPLQVHQWSMMSVEHSTHLYISKWLILKNVINRVRKKRRDLQRKKSRMKQCK